MLPRCALPCCRDVHRAVVSLDGQEVLFLLTEALDLGLRQTLCGAHVTSGRNVPWSAQRIMVQCSVLTPAGLEMSVLIASTYIDPVFAIKPGLQTALLIDFVGPVGVVAMALPESILLRPETHLNSIAVCVGAGPGLEHKLRRAVASRTQAFGWRFALAVAALPHTGLEILLTHRMRGLDPHLCRD